MAFSLISGGKMKVMTQEEFKNKFKFVNVPNTEDLDVITLTLDGNLILEFSRGHRDWHTSYLKNGISGLYSKLNSK